MKKRQPFARFGVLWLALLAACSSKPEAGARALEVKATAKAITVSPTLLEESRIRVIRAELRAPQDVLLATGEIMAEPDGAAEVTAAVAARVASISVRSGELVKKGDTLAVLEAGEVARVTSDLERARARLSAALRVQEQEESLVASRATSGRALSEAKSAVDQARADERAASELLRSYGARSGRQVVLVAPLSGTIVRVAGVIGAPVDATTPLFRIIDTSRLVARADVPESDADLVPEGARATVASMSKVTSCAGTVESHAPIVNAATRTVAFRVRLSPGCGEFHEGAFVDLAIDRSPTDGKPRIALPRAAVVTINEVPVVFIQTDGKAGKFAVRPVRGVTYLGPLVFVDEGIAEGELVVERGTILLKGELMRAELQ
jgi:cobalt-zinc-cadmium efflux system membrane fusion protein